MDGDRAALKRKVTGKIELLPTSTPTSTPSTRPLARSSPSSYTANPHINTPTSSPLTTTQTPSNLRARARVNPSSFVAPPTSSPSDAAGLGARRPMARAITTPAPGVGVGAGERGRDGGSPAPSAFRGGTGVYGSSPGSSVVSRMKSDYGGTVKARVNPTSTPTPIARTRPPTPGSTISRPSVRSNTSTSTTPTPSQPRPNLKPSTSTPTPSHPPSLLPHPTPNYPPPLLSTSPPSTKSLASHPQTRNRVSASSSSTTTSVRTPSRASDLSASPRSPMVFPIGSDVGSLIEEREGSGFREKERGLGEGERLLDERSVYLEGGKGEEEGMGESDMTLRFGGGGERERVGVGGEMQQGDESIGKEQAVVEQAEASRWERKIADLEISNKSLLTVNRNLEGDLARKDRLISSLRRQLRASTGMGSKTHSRDVTSSNSPSATPDPGSSELDFNSGSDAGEEEDDEDEEDPVFAQYLRDQNAHETALGEMVDRVDALVRKGREAMRKVEEIKEGAKGKVLGVLELEEQEELADEAEEEKTGGKALPGLPTEQGDGEGSEMTDRSWVDLLPQEGRGTVRSETGGYDGLPRGMPGGGVF